MKLEKFNEEMYVLDGKHGRMFVTRQEFLELYKDVVALKSIY